jgi:hypothetical protein
MIRELYLIRSCKTEEWENGFRKVSFASDDPDIHAFVWVDLGECLSGIQIILRERVLEWDRITGVSQSDTNREVGVQGNQRGARSIHKQVGGLGQSDLALLKILLFPGEWESLIKSCFNVLEKGS